MKHGKFKRVLALALVLCLTLSLMTTASAARAGQSSGPSWSLSQLIQKIKDKTQSTETQPSEDTGSTSSGTMTLLEDESTVTEGTELRASTYALTSNYATTTLKYFPVTLYNYDADTINAATHQVEVDSGVGTYWNGIYFNEGAPATGSYSYSTGDPVNYTAANVYYSSSGYSDYINNGYYVDVNGTKYLVTDLSCTRKGKWGIYTYSWTITYAGGTVEPTGNPTTLYKADNSASISLPYAPHNVWTNKIYDSTDTTADYTFGKLALRVNSPNNQVGGRAGYVYSGLVQSNLDANKNLIFNYPEGGIFNSDTTVKDIYTNVGLPFDFDGETYTFDAQGNATAKFAGTPSSNTNLTKQSGTGNFLPFGSSDWHFGMAATIPFTMTADGKLSSTNQKDIVFNFAGDDDVWVFIDGVLVLDMGGIHNSVSGSLNFAQNTTSVSATTSSDGSGYLNTTDGAVSGAITGKLFNDNDGTGILNQTLETFAAKDSHELTIFYLERGAGVSNCKIQFNLPMKDTVSVQKLVRDTDSAGQALDAETLAQINNRDFGFTLYKDGDPVANANYSLLNENGQYISTPSTDANGHFTLKNGQTAKFVGEIDSEDGNAYYVVEDKDADAEDFWQVPTWAYTADVANGATITTSTTDGQSMTVTATGSDEAEDSIVFTCTNIWVHQNNTSISAVDDKIVIDYGLPVVIDALVNDTVSNGTKSIESVTGAQYGTATIENGKITYQLTKQLTGVEVLTYTVKATASNAVVSDNKTAEAKIYIIPATSMYYEENFSGLVKFYDDKWSDLGTAQTDPQEPGVVGTVGDSPYGSDAAYRNDSGDSNGTSKYANTTDSAARFSYTFTGTGTSFFARTSGTTATISVQVVDSNSNQVAYLNRNTIYTAMDGTNVGTLYNIPVYTIDGLDYGTYTVRVTVLKKVDGVNSGSDFWLDGIRVINPLDDADKNAGVAKSAYATDGEANMAVVTLRQKLLKESTIDENGKLIWSETDQENGNFVLFTDTNGKITSAEEYKSNGPKEEVYLNNGQSVTFSLTNWDPNTNKIYLGIKAPVGSGTVSINGNSLTIKNAADCYYDITGWANITTDENSVKTATFKIEATSSLISVTNIKVTGNAEFTIVENDDVIVDGNEGSGK